MLQQEAMIERVRQICRADERLAAAMMYGSFAQGEGDEHSDIEFILFFEDEALETLDQEDWVAGISPVRLYFVNEYGIGTAIFENLVRGEFHFDRASDIEKVDESWRETDFFPSAEAALVMDRTGELERRLGEISGPPPNRDTPTRVEFQCSLFLNGLLFGVNVLQRGENARALELLGNTQRHLLWMVRTLEGTTEHWATPSKMLEGDVSETSYARYAACTARLDAKELTDAYLAAWGWGKDLIAALGERYGVAPPATLLENLDRRFVVNLARKETR
jgi:lincosamide nucleotidyltransferase